MSFTKRYIESQMGSGVDVLKSQIDIDCDYVEYDWSYQQESESTKYQYELCSNGNFIVNVNTLSDAFHIKDHIEQNEESACVEINLIDPN
jgi:hypothetical protein